MSTSSKDLFVRLHQLGSTQRRAATNGVFIKAIWQPRDAPVVAVARCIVQVQV